MLRLRPRGRLGGGTVPVAPPRLGRRGTIGCGGGGRVTFGVVIPSAGRESLPRLLRALAAGTGPLPGRVYVVDDRPRAAEPLRLPEVGLEVEVVRGRGRGPAAARNSGWRAGSSEWVAFLDDDV